MKLKNAKISSCVIIEDVNYPYENITNRLLDLGIKKGQKINVLRTLKNGACMIILVGGRLVALSSEIASSITCSYINSKGGLQNE